MPIEGPSIPLKPWHLVPHVCSDETEIAAAEQKFGTKAKDSNNPFSAFPEASFRRAFVLLDSDENDENQANTLLCGKKIFASDEDPSIITTQKIQNTTKSTKLAKGKAFALHIPIPILFSRFSGSLWEAAISTRAMFKQERICPSPVKELANRMVVGLVSGIHQTMGLFMIFDEKTSGLVLPRNATSFYSKTWWQQMPQVGTLVQAWIVPGCENMTKLMLSLKGPIKRGHQSQPVSNEQAISEASIFSEEDRSRRNRGVSILTHIKDQEAINMVNLCHNLNSGSASFSNAAEAGSDSDMNTNVTEAYFGSDLEASSKTIKSKIALDSISVDAIERALADPARKPLTRDDHERIVLADPSSSLSWIGYMAFEVDEGSMTRARAISERALSAIPYRAESEKLNIWIAWLRLEWATLKSGMLNDAEDNFDKVLAEGLARASSPKHLLLAAWELVSEAVKDDIGLSKALRLISHLERLMLAKPTLRASGKIWLALLSSERPELLSSSSSLMMERAKASLAPAAFIKLQTRLALRKYVVGNFDTGRAMMESLVGQHPKRFDLWLLYLQAEQKGLRNALNAASSEDKVVGRSTTSKPSVEYLRRLYERVVVLPFSSKRMKNHFKAFLDFEKTFGSPEDIERVRQLAVAYVERQ